MCYTNADRRFERHHTKNGKSYYINQHGERRYDPKPVAAENGWVVAGVAIAFTLFAAIFASSADAQDMTDDYYRSGAYAVKEMAEKVNKKLDTEEPCNRENLRYEKRREEIYIEARRKLEQE